MNTKHFLTFPHRSLAIVLRIRWFIVAFKFIIKTRAIFFHVLPPPKRRNITSRIGLRENLKKWKKEISFFFFIRVHTILRYFWENSVLRRRVRFLSKVFFFFQWEKQKLRTQSFISPIWKKMKTDFHRVFRINRFAAFRLRLLKFHVSQFSIQRN